MTLQTDHKVSNRCSYLSFHIDIDIEGCCYWCWYRYWGIFMLELRDQYPLSSDEIANRSHGHQQVFISIFSIFISVYSVYHISIYQCQCPSIPIGISLNINIDIQWNCKPIIRSATGVHIYLFVLILILRDVLFRFIYWGILILILRDNPIDVERYLYSY